MKLRLLLLLVFTGVALGQTVGPGSATGTITANSQCVSINVDPRASSTVSINVSGTWSATLQPEASIAGQTANNVQVTPSTSSTAQATITTNGLYWGAAAGVDLFKVCSTSYASGTATVVLTVTTGVASNILGSGGGGGGSGTPGSPTGSVQYNAGSGNFGGLTGLTTSAGALTGLNIDTATYAGSSYLNLGFTGTSGATNNLIDFVNQNTGQISRITEQSQNYLGVINDALNFGININTGGTGCQSSSYACIWLQLNGPYDFDGSNTVEWQVNHANAGSYNGLPLSFLNLNINGTTGVDNFFTMYLNNGFSMNYLSGDGTNVTGVTAAWTSAASGTFTFTNPSGNWAWDYIPGTSITVTGCTPSAYNSPNVGWTLVSGGVGTTTWTVTGVGANPGSSATGCTVQGGIGQAYAVLNPTNVETKGPIPIIAGGDLVANNGSQGTQSSPYGLLLGGNGAGVNTHITATVSPTNCTSNASTIQIYAPPSNPDLWYVCPISTTAVPTKMGTSLFSSFGNGGAGLLSTAGGSGLAGDIIESFGSNGGMSFTSSYSSPSKWAGFTITPDGVSSSAIYAIADNVGSPTTALTTLYLGGWSGVTLDLRDGSTQMIVGDGSGDPNLLNTVKFHGSSGVTAGSFSAITAIATTAGGVTTLTGSSDARLKTDIHSFDKGLLAVLGLHPSVYGWNDIGQKITGFGASERHAGFIAQDVQKSIPEAVGEETHCDLDPHSHGKKGLKLKGCESTTDYLTIADRPILAATVTAVQSLFKIYVFASLILMAALICGFVVLLNRIKQLEGK